jgi:hypothetical protein
MHTIWQERFFPLERKKGTIALEVLFTNYLKTELAVLPAVLYVLGRMLKQASFIKDKNIPLLLGIAGVLIALLWTLGSTAIFNLNCFLMACFAAVTQGILSAGTAIYVHQLFKQQKKDKDK